MDLKKLLNKEQYEAATAVDGPVLVLAGAGSGKTRVLTYRIANMIENLNIYPSQILAITFTNKAAQEMKERVRELVGDEAENMWVSTFHSSCVRILRREIDKIGYNKNFTIYDSADQKTLINQCIKEVGINDKDITDKEIISKIGDQKDNLISAQEYKRTSEKNFRLNRIAEVYLLYQKKLKENNALDFDDLIFKTVELFKKHEDVLQFYQRKFKYIMIDEYQDTNKAQYELARLLAKQHKNLCVVGDDDQCLPEGTMVNIGDKLMPIEAIKEEDEVICAAGNGETLKGKVEKISKKEYSGVMVKIITMGGRTIKATPNHVTFARLNVEKDINYVYLMYKKGMGYRIGQTQSVRSRKGGVKVNGLFVRLNQEKADKMWILKVCRDKSEATYYEQYFSVKYGIPTAVFYSKDRNITLSQEQINKLFSEINTYEAADKLFEENYLSADYPHHMANAVIGGNTSRRTVNINFFSCKKSKEANYYSHRISLITSGEEIKRNMESAGFSVRKEKADTWRIETERRSYDEAESFAKKITQSHEDLSIVRKAKLTEDKSFSFMPFGNIKPSMSIAVYDNGKIVEDVVKTAEFEEYDGFVYDLSIPYLRQYICENVVVHNCIYGWRGADIRNILDFEKDYANAKVIKLEENYRSKGNILKAANGVIKNNPHEHFKMLRTRSEDGNKIRLYRSYSDMEEVEFVCNEIKKAVDSGEKKYKDFAILYRTNAQSRLFEDVFMKRHLPYRIIGGLKFYDRKEIKDIMAYLKLICNPLDNISLKRVINVPKRGIGGTTVDKIERFSNEIEECVYSCLLDIQTIPGLTARNVSAINKFVSIINSFMIRKEEIKVSTLIEELLGQTGYLEELKKSNDVQDITRIENLQELVSAAVDFENNSEDKSLASFLEKTALVADVDNYDVDSDSTVMMTVHSAKGLEFPVVFMVGMENGIFPGAASLTDFAEMEESRRLAYVGITRAKEQLYMTSAQTRRVFGRTVAYGESDFIAEVPKELKEYVNLNPQKPGNMNKFSNSNKSYGNNSFGGFSHTNKDIPPRNTSFKGFSTKYAESILEENTLPEKKEIKALSESEATAGRKVRHAKFGDGTIVAVSRKDGNVNLTIAFKNMGIKNLRLDLAPLQLI
ncbi:UvrD-helicase domain-containing protein [Clostridium sp.]|uniref:UvrD-helicase domain-containing protein n=1 Tax=Clostridium sp. TaxID=1506 RepID=UPI002583F4B3|nr:UvrD-helicase domain-containing protein [Clostridium sp.]MDF2505138.1 helicase, superfamily [Clostridium sp.]